MTSAGGSIQVYKRLDGGWLVRRHHRRRKGGSLRLRSQRRRCDGCPAMRRRRASHRLQHRHRTRRLPRSWSTFSRGTNSRACRSTPTAPRSRSASARTTSTPADYVAANWRPTVQVFRRNHAGAYDSRELRSHPTSRSPPPTPNGRTSANRSRSATMAATSPSPIRTIRWHAVAYGHRMRSATRLQRAGLPPAPSIYSSATAAATASGAISVRMSRIARSRPSIGAVAFGNNGKTLAIAEPLDDSSLDRRRSRTWPPSSRSAARAPSGSTDGC